MEIDDDDFIEIAEDIRDNGGRKFRIMRLEAGWYLHMPDCEQGVVTVEFARQFRNWLEDNGLYMMAAASGSTTSTYSSAYSGLKFTVISFDW